MFWTQIRVNLAQGEVNASTQSYSQMKYMYARQWHIWPNWFETIFHIKEIDIEPEKCA